MQSDFEDALDKIASVRRKLQSYITALTALKQFDLVAELEIHVLQLELADHDLRCWRTAESDRQFPQAGELTGSILNAMLPATNDRVY